MANETVRPRLAGPATIECRALQDKEKTALDGGQRAQQARPPSKAQGKEQPGQAHPLRLSEGFRATVKRANHEYKSLPIASQKSEYNFLYVNKREPSGAPCPEILDISRLDGVFRLAIAGSPRHKMGALASRV